MALSFMKCGKVTCEEARLIGQEFCAEHQPEPAKPEQGALEQIIAHAKTKTPCASNYQCLLADLMALAASHSREKDGLREAAIQVEKWWIEVGRSHFCGAPAAIFNLRAALATPQAQVESLSQQKRVASMQGKPTQSVYEKSAQVEKERDADNRG